MNGIEFDSQQLGKVLDNIVERTMRMDMTWEWGCGVAYYGIAKAYEVTKKEAYFQVLKSRIDELIDLGLPAWTVNSCAMGHSLITIYQATEDDKYLDIIMSKIHYLSTEALRFGDRVLQHTVSSKNDFPEQCWADTLFMAAFFLLRAGIMLDDKAIINDALNQYYWHIQYLQNPETGLWYHGYDNISKSNLSGFYWGRANCWAAYTMSKVKAILPEWYLYPACLEISGSLDEQLSNLKLLQTESGLWRTILDDEGSYEEVSASAGIAAAMLSSGNPLYYKYIQKSLGGISEQIAADGKVMNVSGGTAIMENREGYRNISKRWIQGWGQGLVLTFLGELINRWEQCYGR